MKGLWGQRGRAEGDPDRIRSMGDGKTPGRVTVLFRRQRNTGRTGGDMDRREMDLTVEECCTLLVI